ncbi:MAG: hypothetical protein RIT81_14505 [Deltaproteobacteria bacterium]
MARPWSDADLAERYDTAAFDDLLLTRLPLGVREEIERVMREAVQAYAIGRADAPLEDRASWRRAIVLAWYHSVDIATVCCVLGHPRNVAGIHDLREFVPAGRLRSDATVYDDWYVRFLAERRDDELVDIGFLNPHFCASLCRWGDVKTGRQNAMDAHRASAHHLGHPEAPLDWIEKAVNFVFHHLPREHYGIRHEALAGWEMLEARLADDPAIKDDPIGKLIARDAAVAMQALEEGGYLTPWHRLDTSADAAPPPSAVEHAVAVVGSILEASSGRVRRARDGEPSSVGERWLAESWSADSERSDDVGAELVGDAGSHDSETLDQYAPATLLNVATGGLRAGDGLRATWSRAAAIQETLGRDDLPDVDVEHLASCLKTVESLEKHRDVAASRGDVASAERYEAWRGAWSEDEGVVRSVAEVADVLRSVPEVTALEGFDVDEAAKVIFDELVASSAEQRLVIRHGGGATVIKTTDIMEIAKGTTAANGMMLAARAFDGIATYASVAGGVAIVAMVLAGFRTRSVRVTRKQLLVLDVLRKRKGQELSPEELAVAVEWDADEDFSALEVEKILDSLTRVRTDAGDEKKLVQQTEPGRWRGLDV